MGSWQSYLIVNLLANLCSQVKDGGSMMNQRGGSESDEESV